MILRHQEVGAQRMFHKCPIQSMHKHLCLKVAQKAIVVSMQSPDDNSDDEADKEDGEVEAGAAPQTKEERLEARRAQRRQNEEQAMARLRLLGNMQFVGHLFKKKMLTEKIMHFCIRELLKDVSFLLSHHLALHHLSTD